MTSTLQWQVRTDGFRATLVDPRGREIEIAGWMKAAGTAMPGASILLGHLDDESATEAGPGVVLPHPLVAELPNATAQRLGLNEFAPPHPFLLDLRHSGRFDEKEFHFRINWVKPSGQPVAGARRIGAALRVGSQTYRLSSALYSIVEAAETFNDAPQDDMDGRFRAWAQMQALLPEDAAKAIKIGDYLATTRIADASAFSLRLSTEGDSFTIDPLLFGPHRPPPDGESGLTSEDTALLPPEQQEVFARERFPAHQDCRARYALGKGWYVVLSEPVRRALSVVRRAQRANPGERKQFALNPRAYLRTELGDEVDEELLESVFVETSEYSQRIHDVGLWQKVDVPWIQKQSVGWLPAQDDTTSPSPTVEIPIDEGSIAVAGADIPALRQALETARDQGLPAVDWNGVSVPVGALDVLHTVEDGDAALPPPPPNQSDPLPEKPGKYVLKILNNYEEIEYSRIVVPRPVRLLPGEPAALASSLKPHQQEGLRWLQDSWNVGTAGVLLADDMGLGKTLQAMAFLAWLREGMDTRKLKAAPILVVAPTGLLHNWMAEHRQHFHPPGLGEPLCAFGSGLSLLRRQGGKEIELGRAVLDPDRLTEASWILTSYETMRDYEHSFGAIPFAAVLFDEMQKIKTPGSLVTDAAKALNADFILGMTGTPVENRLADLWCLIDTLQPSLLGNLKEFSAAYEANGDENALKALKTKLTEPSKTADAALPPIMLRRMKADNLRGLPEKTEAAIERPMPPAQARAYDNAIAEVRRREDRGAMLEAIQRLRSISLHPTPADAAANDTAYIAASARLSQAIEILDGIAAKGEKALIFLESLDMQKYLAAVLAERYHLSERPMQINGGVAGGKRQGRVDKFQSSPHGFDVMILSPRAGGVGLTLTAANHVIHLSRWWNPAVEDQCTDRIYRIGQKKEVYVYYPQAIHPAHGEQSFDKKLHELLERKRVLSRTVLAPPVTGSEACELFRETVAEVAPASELRNT